MTDILIRRAALADAQILSEISVATFSQTFQHLYPPGDLKDFLAESYGVESITKTLTDCANAAWLIERQGEIIGHALAGPCSLPHPDVTATCGELKRIYLLPEYQGGGRGSQMLDTALAWLDATGPRALWIGVWSQNLGAQKLYESRGFSKVGEYGFKVGETIDHEFILRKG